VIINLLLVMRGSGGRMLIQFASAFGSGRLIGARAMRYLYIGLIVAFTALILLFKFQNLEP
jgi:hypothetical protein